MSFVHCVRDAVDLAHMAGMAVTVDFYSSWYERGIDALIRKHIDSVALVQISDYRLGTFDMPNRCAIGDGDVPVERLMATVLEAGYQGPFDLEILGPRIEDEGIALRSLAVSSGPAPCSSGWVCDRRLYRPVG